MNDKLPSRDVALGILDGSYDEDNGARIVADLLRLAAEGRLVDREAMDHEWLCIELNHSIRRISNLPGNEGHCYFTSTLNHLTTCGRFGLVAAAIEDTV